VALPAAWAFVHLLKASPFAQTVFDFSSYGMTAILLFTVVLAAVLMPAAGITKLEPITAVRHE